MELLEAPVRECADGCGRTKRTWKEYWICRFCLLAEKTESPLSMREWRRQRDGKCVVCGGPYPDGTGCEHCPRVTVP